MRALLLLMIVAGTLPMAFVRPIVGLILWVGFSYMNPHRITYGFGTAFPWVMIVALVTIFSIAMNSRARQAMPAKPLTILLFVFLAWCGITTLTAVEPGLAQAKWIEFLKIQMMAFATLILVLDRQRLHWIVWAIVLSFGFWGFKGGVFTLLSGGSWHVLGPSHSFFRDNNGFALVMCMTLPLMRYLQLIETRRWVRYGLWALMGFTVVSIIGTYSRGGFLALLAVSLMLFMKSRGRAGLLVVGAMLAVAMISFMPEKYFGRIDTITSAQQDDSVNGRIESWKFATNVALARPATGGGFSVWASQSMWRRYGPEGATPRAIHSIFFEILGEQGFVGLGLYITMLIVGWRSLARIRKQARAGPEVAWMGDLASMIQVSLVGFVCAGGLLPMPYFDLFYQLLALTVILQVLLQRALSEAREPVESAGVKATRTPALPSRSGVGYPGTPVSTSVSGGRRLDVSSGQKLKDLPRW